MPVVSRSARSAYVKRMIDNVRYVPQLEHIKEWEQQRLTVTRLLASLANASIKRDLVKE